MPPQQPPPEGMGAGDAPALLDADAPATDANIDRRRREPTWPFGQSTGADASDMGRRTSKVSSQSGQRYS
jgi:hypothetical protein